MIIPLVIFSILLFILSSVWLLFAIRTRRERNIIDFSWRRTVAKRVWADIEPKTFVYLVDGKEYEWKPTDSDRVSLCADEVEIYYDPENKSKVSAVERAPLWHSIVASIVSGGIGGVMFYYGFFAQSSEEVLQLIANNFFSGLGLIFALIGILLTFFVLRRLYVQQGKKRRFISSEATVIELLSAYGIPSNRLNTVAPQLFMPVFQYFVDGKTYRMVGYSSKHQTYTNVGVLDVGTKKTIWINPTDVRDAFVDEPKGVGIGMLVMGVCFFVMGILVLILV